MFTLNASVCRTMLFPAPSSNQERYRRGLIPKTTHITRCLSRQIESSRVAVKTIHKKSLNVLVSTVTPRNAQSEERTPFILFNPLVPGNG